MMVRLLFYVLIFILALLLIWLPGLSQGLDTGSFLFGASILASVGVLLLLVVHWYVHRRGKRRR